ncbi:MAG: SPFH domain-containing protein [Planctomycetota bacterium]
MRTNAITLVVTALIVLGFLVYMSTFTVRFNEVAILTTFGKAGENSVVSEPGLRFKWPSPVQATTIYDKRLRFLQGALETQQTADDKQIVVELFCAYRVSDPLAFHQRFQSAGSSSRERFNAADERLRTLMRSASASVSAYTIGELFGDNADEQIAALESDILNAIRGGTDDGAGAAANGIDVQLVGISRILLPERTSQEVITRMRATRQRLAANAESVGLAESAKILADASSDASRIMNFAEFVAAEIRNKGDEEASQFIAALDEDPEFFAFLSQLDLLRQGLGRRATVVLDSSFAGMGAFDPDAIEQARNGEIPDQFRLDGDAGGDR